MNVLLISPGFPAEMPHFTRGLAQVGANVFGLGDQPLQSLPREVQSYLTGYERVPNLWDEDAVVKAVASQPAARGLDRVECLWEPGMMLAAKLREALDVPGLRPAETEPFRDKERMKQVLDAAGLRTPHHYRARTADEVREAAERIGWPVIVKPIDGAGSADTYTARSDEELDRALALVRHVPEVSVEEFVEGEEYTFDTICAGGEILLENVAWYRPKPLVARLNEWISAVGVCFRDLDRPELQDGRALGREVLRALGFQTGFTHMEWFRTPSGEAVFGEIGGRPPGARLVHLMNYACDADLFAGWAEAVCKGRIDQDLRKRYCAAVVFKRARGGGRTVTRYDGLDALLARFGEHVANVELTGIGEPRKDWRKSAVGDGWIVVRHPDLQTTLDIADRFGAEFEIRADA